jgi:hypothetical protein
MMNRRRDNSPYVSAKENSQIEQIVLDDQGCQFWKHFLVVKELKNSASMTTVVSAAQRNSFGFLTRPIDETSRRQLSN